MKLRLLSCALCGLAPLSAQTITFAEGTPTSLTIVHVPESAPNSGDTILLQDVELLDLELTGRTLAQASDPGHTRRVALQGIHRAELPGGGRVFRYRRGGGAFWGFLHVSADGTPRVVLEQPGVGAALNDPFFDRIAIAPDGLRAAIALQAGGLRIVRLDGGVFASTGRADWIAASSQLEVLPNSVMVGAQFVFYQTEQPERVWRCALADGSLADDVSPPAQSNAFFKDQMALSGDGERLVYLYGPQNLQRLWLVGPTGAPALLPLPASKYEEPNYLPEDAGEPAMLLNHDGTRLFCIDSDVRDELYLLDTTGVLTPLQITEDAIFEPYIGVHILPRFAADKLTVAIGDIAQMDWFQVRLAAGGHTVANLTGTGSLLPPFVPGTIDPQQSLDGGAFLLVTEQAPAGLRLRHVDPATGAAAIVGQALTEAPRIGSATQGTADILVRSAAGDSLYSGQSGGLLGTLPPDLLLTPPVQGPQFAAAWLHIASGYGVSAYYLPNGTHGFGVVDFDVRQIALTAAGGAVEMGTSVRYLAIGVYMVLNRPTVPHRLCLSGVSN